MKHVKTIVFLLVFSFLALSLYFGAKEVLSQGMAVAAVIVLILHEIFLVVKEYGAKYIRKSVLQIFLTATVFWILAIVTGGAGINLKGALGLIVLIGILLYNYYKWIKGWGVTVHGREESL